MVIRLDQSNRRDINDLKNLYVTTPNGEQIPLQELASIEYTEGPQNFMRQHTEELWLELMCETETCKVS
jgi:cobalt-zinc-cadmium resistance protein CzcA